VQPVARTILGVQPRESPVKSIVNSFVCMLFILVNFLKSSLGQKTSEAPLPSEALCCISRAAALLAAVGSPYTAMLDQATKRCPPFLAIARKQRPAPRSRRAYRRPPAEKGSKRKPPHLRRFAGQMGFLGSYHVLRRCARFFLGPPIGPPEGGGEAAGEAPADRRAALAAAPGAGGLRASAASSLVLRNANDRYWRTRPIHSAPDLVHLIRVYTD